MDIDHDGQVVALFSATGLPDVHPEAICQNVISIMVLGFILKILHPPIRSQPVQVAGCKVVPNSAHQRLLYSLS